MSETRTRIKTTNLNDPAPVRGAVDGTSGKGNNQSSGQTVKMAALDLETTTERTPMTQRQKKMMFILGAVAIVAGIGTGYGAWKLRTKTGGTSSPIASQQVAGEVVNNGDVFGVTDDQTFKDSAEGYLEAGGTNGEGSHSLLRAGGPSQTVHLTSSITDLDKFIGMQIKVWGETFKGQKAGWLMDVGRVQVIEVNGQAPIEE
jgi:hypothetical protein